MDLVVCSPTAASASTVTSSVIDDKDTEWRATREFLQTGKRIREKKHCEYCDKLYAGGPDMIRAHLLAEIKPRSVGPAFLKNVCGNQDTIRMAGCLLTQLNIVELFA